MTESEYLRSLRDRRSKERALLAVMQLLLVLASAIGVGWTLYQVMTGLARSLGRALGWMTLDWMVPHQLSAHWLIAAPGWLPNLI